MRAVTMTQPGGPEVLRWTEVPDPVPGSGEVLVEVTASAVNRADILQRRGAYDPPPGASPYLGLECSGRIVAVGDGVTRWGTGDEVCALLSGGGYAERVAVPFGQLLPVPRVVGTVDAAGLPEVACTVWANVVDLAHLKPGEKILVHGGGSGIGTFAIQLAKALGATVFTTARAEKHQALRELGADVTIDYRTEDFVDKVQAAGGADVILDNMGAAYLSRNVEVLAEAGRLVVIGMQGGRTADLDLGMLLAKRGMVAAAHLRNRTAAQKASIVRGVHEEIWPLIEEGLIRPVVDRRLPMSDAAEAHRIVESSEHIGKVLLVTNGSTLDGRDAA
jgi:putative PIG3 family NAD(P)H quinone oxidoreductase